MNARRIAAALTLAALATGATATAAVAKGNAWDVKPTTVTTTR